MRRKTLIILGVSYLVLIAMIVVIGLAAPPWWPVSSAAGIVPTSSPTLNDVVGQQTSQSGLSTLESKIESGTVQPSYQGVPFTPYPVGEQAEVNWLTPTPTLNAATPDG